MNLRNLRCFSNQPADAGYPQSTQSTIWLQRLQCQDNETTILECSMSKWGASKVCTHTGDVIIQCSASQPPGGSIDQDNPPAFQVLSSSYKFLKNHTSYS